MNKQTDHNPNDVGQLADRWLHHLRNQKYSPKSVKTYRYPLNYFLSFLAEHQKQRIQDVTESDLVRYRQVLLDRNFSSMSIELYMRTVRQFFRYLEEIGHIFVNPAERLVVPKPQRRLPKVPTEKEITQLLAQPNTATSVGIRDRAILELAYSTGARLEELTSLTLFQPNLKEHTLRILGKGRKERVVPLGKQTVYWLETYLKTARSGLLNGTIDEQALWIGIGGKKLSSQAIGVLVRKYSKQANLNSLISPHALRRACATHMLQNGAHPVQIQMLLGHADLRHLGQYLRLTITDLKKTHRNSKVGK